MYKTSKWMVLALLVVLATGCGGGDSPSPTATSDASSNQATIPAIGPDQAVFTFLEAVRTADEQQAAQMLTRLAREKTAEQGMMVAPQGSDTARFEVTEIDLTIGPGKAHVGCIWTDVDEDGVEHSDNIVWMLRQEDGAWRIAGMATKVFEDQPPLLLDFEDPADMLRKQEMVQQEMLRRAEQADEWARQPQRPADATPR